MGLETIEHAHEYLESDLFNADVVAALTYSARVLDAHAQLQSA